ncbi:MAG: SMC-Scp complex subunit ScpB [Thermodesulfobacteriota bacterium]
MDPETLVRAVEALLFASPEPLPLSRLAEVFAPDGVEPDRVRDALGELEARCAGRGVELREVAGGYQLRTRPELAPWLARLEAPRAVRFSRAALETLAIVAYRQPVTRAELEEVRGVDCGGVLKLLLDRGLARILGKKDVPGRPLLYGTTRKFLEAFGLSSLGELPNLKDIEDLLAARGEGQAEPAGAQGLPDPACHPGCGSLDGERLDT